MYTPWAFQVVNEIFSTLPEVEWLTTLCPIMWSASGTPIYCAQRGGYTRQGFFKGTNVPDNAWYSLGAIQQESVFWRRALWEKAGAKLDTNYPLAADFELWARFFQHANLYTVSVPLSGFRAHSNQRSVSQFKQYQQEVKAILAAYGGRTLGKLERIATKITKDYLPLPCAIRRQMASLKIKPIHHHCGYSLPLQRWQIHHL